MFTNAPTSYICPICLGVQGIESENTLLKQPDLIYKDKLVSAFINSFWIKGNEGHVIIVPNQHYENLYELPTEEGLAIFELSKKISLALKEKYHCDGVTLRQNNEPAADQHAFHYHLHVFPRYTDDNFNFEVTQEKRLSDQELRMEYVEKLKSFLKL